MKLSQKSFLQGQYQEVERLLGDFPNAAFLRNHDLKESLARGGDIDLLVGDIAQARDLLLKRFGNPWWILKRSYVEGWFYPWGHIDLVPSFEWRGAVILDTQEMLIQVMDQQQGIAKLRTGHEAVISWFSSLIWGGFFKKRYSETIVGATMVDGKAFGVALERSVGAFWGRRLFECAKRGHPEESESWVRPLRRSLWWRSFRSSPFRTFCGLLNHWKCESALRLFPSTPLITVIENKISGCSKIVEKLSDYLEFQNIKYQVFHWSPQTLGVFDAKEVRESEGRIKNNKINENLLVKKSYLDVVAEQAKGSVVIIEIEVGDLDRENAMFRLTGSRPFDLIARRLLSKPQIVFSAMDNKASEDKYINNLLRQFSIRNSSRKEKLIIKYFPNKCFHSEDENSRFFADALFDRQVNFDDK